MRENGAYVPPVLNVPPLPTLPSVTYKEKLDELMKKNAALKDQLVRTTSEMRKMEDTVSQVTSRVEAKDQEAEKLAVKLQEAQKMIVCLPPSTPTTRLILGATWCSPKAHTHRHTRTSLHPSCGDLAGTGDSAARHFGA